MDSLVKLENVSFHRGSRLIYKDINIRAARGQITAILGPSGAGKTTLLELIGGQLKPTSGIVNVAGKNVSTLSRKKLYQLRKKMGLLFQSGALFTNLSAYENVAFPLRENTHLPEEIIHDVTLMKLEAVGLRGAASLMPCQLSGGMARRVALARTIALDPELIMYDEPFTGLDPISLGVIVTLIKELNNALGMTSIIVSHDVEETLGIADYVYMIADGQVIGEGTPAQMMANDDPKVKQFIHGLPDGPVPFHYQAKPYQDDLMKVTDDV